MIHIPSLLSVVVLFAIMALSLFSRVCNQKPITIGDLKLTDEFGRCGATIFCFIAAFWALSVAFVWYMLSWAAFTILGLSAFWWL